MNFLRKIKSKLFRIWKPENKYSPLEYWESRSRKFGARAVLNLGIKKGQEEDFRKKQMNIIFPHLKKIIQQKDVVLDYGCGVGRFTVALQKLSEGKVVGVDPIQRFLDMAPKAKNVSYLKLKNGVLPLADDSMDIIFICLVLGGIPNCEIDFALKEIRRVLKNDGEICLVENTSAYTNHDRWTNRSVTQYKELFSWTNLKEVAAYKELEEDITIFIGRKLS